MIKILNWNTQADQTTPTSRNGKFQRIQQRIQSYAPDVICLTEAYPQTMPTGGYTITSGLSGWKHDAKGARKVVLWSKNEWFDVDMIGSDELPEGRFIRGKTVIGGFELNVVGICIPYRDYRNRNSWGEKRKTSWQGACEYLDALRLQILTRPDYQSHTILLGDFNLQIPPENYPRPTEPVNQKREQTFEGWHIPTSGDIKDPALDKRFIDHVALTPDLNVTALRFFSRFDYTGSELSDHNGVYFELQPHYGSS